MFPSNNSLFGGLSKVILTLVIIGAVVGLVLSDSDLTNFITNSAEAEAIKNQNDLQVQKDAVDVKNYQAIQETTTQIKIDQLLAESATYQKSLEQGLQFQAQKAAQDLETARFVSYAGTGAGVFVAFCIGIGFVILMIQVGRSRKVVSQAQVKKLEAWQDLAWRKQQIMISRQLERAERERLVRLLNEQRQLAEFRALHQELNRHRPISQPQGSTPLVKQPGNGRGLHKTG